MSVVERLRERIHRPLRLSRAPHLTALLRSFARGLLLISPRAVAQTLYLDSARREWLSDYAEIYGILRAPNESDEDLRLRVKQSALTRTQATRGAIEEAISQATGQNVLVEPTQAYLARYDDLERMAEGYHMADYVQFVRVESGNTVGFGQGQWGDGQWPGFRYDFIEFETPPTHRGYRGLTPLRPGWGPNGMLLTFTTPYQEELEQQVVYALSDNIPAATGFDVFWAHEFVARLQDDLLLTDALTPQGTGWGYEGWGGFPWPAGKCALLSESAGENGGVHLESTSLSEEDGPNGGVILDLGQCYNEQNGENGGVHISDQTSA